jgi:hypothetical protein
LQGGDFVLVVGDELLEGLNQAFGAVEGGRAEAGFDDLVLADVVDGEFVFGFDVEDELAQGGVAEGFGGGGAGLVCGGFTPTPALPRRGGGSKSVEVGV